MIAAAVFHRATDSWCYPLDARRLHIRLATARGDVDEVRLRCGDPHEWLRPPEGKGAWTWKNSLLNLELTGTDGARDFWEGVWEPPYKRARYGFWLRSGETWFEYGEKGLYPALQVEAEAGKASPAAREPPEGDYWNAFVFPYINEVDLYKAPEWVTRTVWYQIFPDRFRNGNPKNDPPGTRPWTAGPVTNHELFGGDLAGIIEKLDYLADLGVNGLYLTPIFAAPSVHKYDTEDYLRIDPAFGSEEELKLLVEGCHARGIRVMLDAVFNHSGRTFAPWLDVVEKGRDSAYAEWFHIRSWPLFPKGRDTGDSREAGFETFAFTTRMPKLNTANPAVRDFLVGVGERYVRDFDIDGWRLDVSNEVDHEFWRLFRTRIKALKPDTYLVGEIWHDAMPWLRGDQYDAVMNYPYGNAISDFLLGRRYAADAPAFARRLAAIDFSYPLPVLRHNFNLMDSHDTERLVHRMGGDLELARLGWLLMFMLPGSPCIYYGTEWGLEGGGDPDNRRCMPWGEAQKDETQHAFIKSLITLRKEVAGLVAGAGRTITVLEGEPGFLLVEIGAGKERMACLVNRDPGLLAGAAIAKLLEGRGLAEARVLLADPREEAHPAAADPLLPRGFRILASEG